MSTRDYIDSYQREREQFDPEKNAREIVRHLDEHGVPRVARYEVPLEQVCWHIQSGSITSTCDYPDGHQSWGVVAQGFDNRILVYEGQLTRSHGATMSLPECYVLEIDD